MIPLTAAFPHCSVVRGNLGVTLDQELTLAPHIHSLCRSYYYQLKQLRTVYRALTGTATTTLVHSFFACRLDYSSSSLYICVPAIRLNCLAAFCAMLPALLVGYLNLNISAYNAGCPPWAPSEAAH